MSESEILFMDVERVGSLIGKKGKNKKFLEEKFNAKIDINSKNGEVKIDCEDSLNEYILKSVITAVSFGHNPEKAVFLRDDNFVHDFIDVKDFVDRNKVEKVIGRVVGKNGSVRHAVSEITQCDVTIYKNYISFMGPYENIHLIHDALIMLIKGAAHKSFYRYLEENKVDLV